MRLFGGRKQEASLKSEPLTTHPVEQPDCCTCGHDWFVCSNCYRRYCLISWCPNRGLSHVMHGKDGELFWACEYLVGEFSTTTVLTFDKEREMRS